MNGSFGLVGSLLTCNELSSLDPLHLKIPVAKCTFGDGWFLCSLPTMEEIDCSFDLISLVFFLKKKGGPNSFACVPSKYAKSFCYGTWTMTCALGCRKQ